MKQKFIVINIAVLIIFNSTIPFVSAQEWVNTTGTTNSWHQPEYNNFPDVESIGIGDFITGGFQPRSAFEINTNLYFGPNANPSYTNLGEVFRTNCPEDMSTYWRLWRVQNGNDTEYGSIYSLSRNDDYTNTQTGVGTHFYLQSSAIDDETGAWGDIRFNTGTGGTNLANNFSQPRMRILGNNGNVGVGDYDAFLPNYQLHQHVNNDGGTFHQFTIPITGILATDGFRMGIDANANGEFNLMNNTVDMHFLTNTTARATILGANGFIGIGDYTTFTPRSLLHQHDNSNANVFHQFTNGNTGSGNNFSGFRMGIEFIVGANRSDVWFRNWQNNGQFNFASNDNNGTQLRRIQLQNQVYLANEVTRMKIIENDLYNAPYSANPPVSLLHLGHHWVPNAGGHRLWMDVGSYTCARSDQLYTGMKEATNSANFPWTPNMDAVINWGDNIQGQEGADNLRVILTTPQAAANGDAGTVEGLEVMRFTPLARVGIGNFDAVNGSALPPSRRLEIYDENVQNSNFPLALQFGPAPQLRLTFIPNANVALGINTDFQTTGLGNLIVTPQNAGVVANAGIGNFNIIGVEPARRLELLDQAQNNPQLRLTFTPNTNPALGIWTDFQTMNNGDMHINNSNNSNAAMVGINNGTGVLTRTLDVNGNLRIRTLPTAPFNANGSATINKFLVSNGNGEVFWRDDIGNGTGDITACNTLSNADVNFVSKWSSYSPNQICSTIAFDDGSRFGINTNVANPAQPLFYTFQNAGRALFTKTTNIPSASLPTYNTNNYSLGVMSDANQAFVIYNDHPTFTDRFRMFMTSHTDANSPNHAFINTVSMPSGDNSPLVISGIGGLNSNQEYFATNPVNGNTVIKNTFSTTGSNVSLWFRAKLYVEDDGSQNCQMASAIWGNNNGACTSSWHPQIGVHGSSTAVRTLAASENIGGLFEAEGNNSGNIAVRGNADFTHANSTNVGGDFTASLGLVNYAVRGTTPQVGTSCNTTSCANAAGYFQGDLAYTGIEYAVSDSILKDSIIPLPTMDSLINTITAYSFTYDNTNYPYLNMAYGEHYGFIAQQVAAVFPNMVKQFVHQAEYDTSGNLITPELSYKALNYNEFIPILWNQNKNLKDTLDTLKNRLAILEQLVASCCNLLITNPSQTGSINSIKGSIELENLKSIQLEQNDPNPFGENSMVRWSIPTDFKDANILFFDNSGSQINTFKIDQQGYGEVQVFGSKLSSGVYTYTLVVDGKIIDSKKMIKAK